MVSERWLAFLDKYLVERSERTLNVTSDWTVFTFPRKHRYTLSWETQGYQGLMDITGKTAARRKGFLTHISIEINPLYNIKQCILNDF